MTGAILGEILGTTQGQKQETNGNSLPIQSGRAFSSDSLLSLALASAMVDSNDFQGLLPLWEKRNQLNTLGLPIITLPDTAGNTLGNEKMEGTPIYTYLMGYAAYRLDDVLEQSARIAQLTHAASTANREVAQAVAAGVFLGHNRFSKRYFKAYFEDQYDVDLAVPHTALKESYQHTEQPMTSVYRALISLLQSTDYEDAMRISLLTGDRENKQAFITGAMAEAYYQHYPIPLLTPFLQSLPAALQEVINTFNRKFQPKSKENYYKIPA